MPGDQYTFYYSCTGAGAGVDRGDAGPVRDPESRRIRIWTSPPRWCSKARGGLTGSTITTPNACTIAPTTPTSCVNIGDIEQIPISGNATPGRCQATTPQIDVTRCYAGCIRGCPTDLLRVVRRITPPRTAPFAADTDPAAGYGPDGVCGERPAHLHGGGGEPAGVGHELRAAMTVLGFRQFLLDPAADGSYNPGDANGRFAALYLGSVQPLPQGWFDTRYAPACRSYLTTGPGKVVLHQ